MTHLSEHDLWGAAGNRVVTLPPADGDVFVALTVAGAAAALWPVDEYDKAVEIAERFARRFRTDRPVAIKVLSVSLREAQRFGFLPAGPMPAQTPDQDAKDRQFAVDTLWRLVRESDNVTVRGDALDLLRELGEVK